MTVILLRAVGLTAIYLLVLTSVSPGDVLIGGMLGLGLAYALRPRELPSPDRAGRMSWPAAAVTLVRRTGAEMIRGTWSTARFCLREPSEAGFVELPREDRSHAEIAFWGVLTGEAPDEIPVDVTDDALVVHLIDASDVDGVRERHRRNRRWQRRLAP